MIKHSPDPEIIKNMFSKVASKYDTANSILSIGIHHLWRKKLVYLSAAKTGQKILDCVIGTAIFNCPYICTLFKGTCQYA